MPKPNWKAMVVCTDPCCPNCDGPKPPSEYDAIPGICQDKKCAAKANYVAEFTDDGTVGFYCGKHLNLLLLDAETMLPHMANSWVADKVKKQEKDEAERKGELMPKAFSNRNKPSKACEAWGCSRSSTKVSIMDTGKVYGVCEDHVSNFDGRKDVEIIGYEDFQRRMEEKVKREIQGIACHSNACLKEPAWEAITGSGNYARYCGNHFNIMAKSSALVEWKTLPEDLRGPTPLLDKWKYQQRRELLSSELEQAAEIAKNEVKRAEEKYEDSFQAWRTRSRYALKEKYYPDMYVGSPLEDALFCRIQGLFSDFARKRIAAIESRYTQKHRGIKYLWEQRDNLPFGLAVLRHSVGSPHGLPAFARPCPKTPKHGFVDSRVVVSMAQVQAILEETKRADPEGEVLFADPIQATHSAVVTSNALAVGKGNDGATSGEGITIPVAGENYGRRVVYHGLTEGQDLYAEFVRGEISYVVQLREGPPVEAVLDYIPRSVTVSKVHGISESSEDLLAWEGEVKRIAEDPNAVVYAPGKALTSHWGVHCVINEVPFITTFEPKEGQAITKSEGASEKGKFSQRGFHEGFTFGWTQRASKSDACLFALSVLHNVPAMTPAESRLIGAAVAFTVRLGITAVEGELRHGLKRPRSRDYVYNRVWHKPRLSKLFHAPEIFDDGPNTLGAGGYGGDPWKQCALETAKLVELATAHDLDVNDVVKQLNVVINCAHNNGWWFNKFIDRKVFDEAGRWPSWGLARTCHLVYEVMRFDTPKQVLKGLRSGLSRIKNARKRREKAGSDNSIIAAQVSYRDAIDGLHVQYKDGTKTSKEGNYKTVNFPMPQLVEKFRTFKPDAKSWAGGSELKYVRLKTGGDKNRSLYWPDGSFFVAL